MANTAPEYMLQTESVIKQYKQYDTVITAVNRASIKVEPGEFVAYFAAVVRRSVVDEYNFHFAIRLVCQTADALAQHVAWDFVYGNDKTKIGHIASLFRLESGSFE